MHLFFVCTGNICRSPSAALVVAEQVRRAGLDDRVRVTSAGVDPWHVGEPIDRRAGDALARRGYAVEHIAAQVRTEDLRADLILAMDRGHEKALRKLVDDPARVRLLRSFDPGAAGAAGAAGVTGSTRSTGGTGSTGGTRSSRTPGDLDVPDPYYGGPDGFEEVLDMIEAATPGLLTWVREHLDA